MSDAAFDPVLSSHPEAPRSPQAVNYLFAALIPLIFWMLRGDIGSLVAGIFLLGLFGYAAHLIVIALEDEEIGLTLTSRLPRKLVGSGLIGFGALVLSLVQLYGLAVSLGLGMLAFALSVVAFGVDARISFRTPLKKSATKQTRKLVNTAERVLAGERVSEVEDEPSFLQAQAFRHTMLEMMARYPDALEESAAELRHVLNEAAEATDIFVEEFGEDPDPRFKRRYMQLLKELAEAMEACLIELSEGEFSEAPAFEEEDAIFSNYDNRHVA